MLSGNRQDRKQQLALEMIARSVGGLDSSLSGDAEVGRLVGIYDQTEGLLLEQEVQQHESLSDAVSVIQDGVVELLGNTPSKTLYDVFLKLDLWRRDNEEVDSPSASRGERLATKALDDFERLLMQQKKAA